MNPFRRSLRSTLAVSAGAYGYTLTIWGTGAIGIDVLGAPHPLDVLLFMSGAVVAFVGLEALATGSWRLGSVPGETSDATIWAYSHVLSAGGAILSAWALDRLIAARAGWPVSGAGATAVYLLLAAAQARVGSRP